jgi:hypothetical protein
LFDLPASLAPTRFEQPARVLGIQMRPELAQGRQVQLTPSDQRERFGKATTHPSPGHAAPGGSFAHPKRLNTIRKGRREAELQMELALLELSQVCEHIRRQFIAASNQVRQTREQIRILQAHQSITDYSSHLGHIFQAHRENAYAFESAT